MNELRDLLGTDTQDFFVDAELWGHQKLRVVTGKGQVFATCNNVEDAILIVTMRNALPGLLDVVEFAPVWRKAAGEAATERDTALKLVAKLEAEIKQLRVAIKQCK